MSGLAVAFQRAGWLVTGSDAGFYPPISDFLKDNDVDFYPGWHPEKMQRRPETDGQLHDPDLVVVGTVVSSANPEWLYVQERGIPFQSYPEVIADYLLRHNSIVCAGTYGKTSSTALLAWILTQAGLNPSYMFGGLLSTSVLHPAAFTVSDWSVVEGDEYKTSRSDKAAKFFHYRPTHLLLSAIVWDHADVYASDEAYRAAFQKLWEMVPSNGQRVISEQALPLISVGSGLQNYVTYGAEAHNNYVYTNIVQSKKGSTFIIKHKNNNYPIETICLGSYMADNITGCFAMALQLGVAAEHIISAIKSFPGLKRRMEKRYEGAVTIFDDIAHSPAKASSVLQTLRALYDKKIYAVFEPNTGNRRPEAVLGYQGAFCNADEVFIPRLTKLKKESGSTSSPLLEGKDIQEILQADKVLVNYIHDDQELLSALGTKIRSGDVVVFLGSHGFRGMIEELIAIIQALKSTPSTPL